MHEDTYKQHLKEVGKKIMYQVIMTVHHGRVDSCHSIQVQINGCKVIGTYTFGIKSMKVKHILRVRLSLFFKGHT